MNIQKRLQIEFEFLGDEQIYANTALKIVNDVFKEAEIEQLTIGGVSKSFNSEEELLQFIYMNTPIAIKPKSKLAKGQLVSAFKSGNAFEQVCRQLAKKLFNVC